MSVSTAFIDQLKDLFEPLGHITARRMFGGATLFCDGVAFGLIDGDVLYLRADDATKQRFVDEGLSQFTYEGKTGPVALKYWRAPERLFDEPDESLEWGRSAVQAALAADGQAAKASRSKSQCRCAEPIEPAARVSTGDNSASATGVTEPDRAAETAARPKAKSQTTKRLKK